MGTLVFVMGTRQESIEKDIRGINELESLDVTAKARNELNDLQEISLMCNILRPYVLVKSSSVFPFLR